MTPDTTHQPPSEPLRTVDPDAIRRANADRIITDLRKATLAAFDLLSEMIAARSDGDEWTRLPRPKERCPVSFFSRSKINDLIAAGKLRAKTVQGGRYYSLADMRSLIRNTGSQN